MSFFWVVFWLATAALTATALKGPKQQAPAPSTLEDFGVPKAKNGALIPVLFGTKDITDPNVLWYGDLKTSPVSKSGGK